MKKLVLRLFFDDGSVQDIELPPELEEEKQKAWLAASLSRSEPRSTSFSRSSP